MKNSYRTLKVLLKELAEMCLKFRKTGTMDRTKFFRKLDDYLEEF